jgi:hypothetical protein
MRRLAISVAVLLLVASCGDGRGSADSSSSVSPPSTETATSTSTVPDETPTSTTEADAEPTVASITWSPAQAPVVDMVTHRVVATPSGFAAMGVRIDADDPLADAGVSLLVSADGSRWEEVPAPLASDEFVGSWTSTPWGVVGVVHGPEGSAGILASPDGRTWLASDPRASIESEGPGFLGPAIWGPEGLVVVHNVVEGDEEPLSRVLASGDMGLTYSAVPGSGSPTVDIGFVEQAIAGEAGVILLTHPDQPGSRGIRGWWLPDRDSLIPITIGDEVVSGSGGAIGLGEAFVVQRDVFDPDADEYGPMAWVSDGNPEEWTDTQLGASDWTFSGGSDSLVGTGNLLVAIAMPWHGHDEAGDSVDRDGNPIEPEPAIVVSTDFSTWVESTPPLSVAAEVESVAVIPLDDGLDVYALPEAQLDRFMARVVVAALTFEGGSPRSELWVGEVSTSAPIAAPSGCEGRSFPVDRVAVESPVQLFESVELVDGVPVLPAEWPVALELTEGPNQFDVTRVVNGVRVAEVWSIELMPEAVTRDGTLVEVGADSLVVDWTEWGDNDGFWLPIDPDPGVLEEVPVAADAKVLVLEHAPADVDWLVDEAASGFMNHDDDPCFGSRPLPWDYSVFTFTMVDGVVVQIEEIPLG